MRTHPTIERLRRGLVLFLSTVALASCGDDSPTGTPPEDPLTTANGQVTLPAALPGPVTDYAARSPFGTSEVAADGSFAVPVLTDGPTLAWLENSAGQLVLFGFVDPAGSGAISSLDTATALLFWGVGGHLLADEENSQLLAFLRAQSVTSSLAADIETALTANTGALEIADSDVRTALLAALGSIAPPPAPATATESTRGGGGGFVDVVPDAPQSGLLVQRMVDQAGLDVRTDRPRTGYYYFYLKEYLDEYGGSHEVAPPQLLAEGETPFPSLFANAFTGFEGASLAESQLDPPLLLVPEGTNIQQVYDLVVTGAHFPDLTPEPAWVASHPNPARDTWRQTAARMPALAFVKDVLLPSLFSVTVPRALREVETNITAESAQAFVDAMAVYEPTLSDLIGGGEWQRAAVLLLRRYADDEMARGAFIDQVNAWTGLRFDIEYGLFYFWSMLERAESYYDAILEGFSNFDITGVASAARDAERMDLWEVTFDTATIALATGRGYVSRELNELRIRPVIPRVPENHCVRWVLDGAGSLAEWVQGEAPNPVGTELWTGGEIVYVVDPGDVVAGATVTITAELYDEICNLAPGSEPIGTASAVIEQRELNLDPCEGFDLEFWQEGTTSPDWTFDLLTPVIAGGDDIVIEVTNNRNVTAEVTLYIPCVYVNGNSPYPGTEHVSVTGAGPNVNYFVVDNDAMWHWRRQDVVGYPLVSWGIILWIQTIDPLATFTVTVPTTQEFSESAHFRPCPDFGPWGPGGTTALGSLGFIGDSNYNWFDRMIIVE